MLSILLTAVIIDGRNRKFMDFVCQRRYHHIRRINLLAFEKLGSMKVPKSRRFGYRWFFVQFVYILVFLFLHLYLLFPDCLFVHFLYLSIVRFPLHFNFALHTLLQIDNFPLTQLYLLVPQKKHQLSKCKIGYLWLQRN